VGGWKVLSARHCDPDSSSGEAIPDLQSGSASFPQARRLAVAEELVIRIFYL